MFGLRINHCTLIKMVCFADFTDALFNPTKGTEKTTKPPKQVKKERKNIISNTFGFPVNPNNTN